MQRFGAYEILHELRSGGMGSVLLARRRGPGTFEQLVAIKTILPAHARSESVRAMFLDEAAILARLSHPAVATVHDFGEEGGTLYMVMEYVAGISFRALGELSPPPGVIARAVVEACRGLHAAHELRDLHGQLLGVVHRDISPDNLMLGYDGHVKVIDFGIALVKNRQAPVTELGTLKGKPPYMSPEQLKNAAIDRRSDVFSLGVVLHELLTGEPLFHRDSIYATARAVEHDPIPAPSQLCRRALPPGLDSAVLAALERDPARRMPTAAALAEHLEQAIHASPDETLEAWADRELRSAREAHRAWLATLAGGTGVTPMGRPTGAVTALGDALPPRPAPAEVAAPPERSELGATTRARTRRSVAPLVIGVFALLAAVGAVVMSQRTSMPQPDAGTVAMIAPDAAADAHAVPDAAVALAADAAIVADAAPPRRRDAGPRPMRRDAGVRTVARDAAPPIRDAAPRVTGNGTLIVKHRADTPSFLNVMVDGVYFGPTPILRGKPIAAGTHTVELVAPASGQVVYRTRITVEPGGTATVTQP